MRVNSDCKNALGTQLESCESFGRRPHVIDRSPEGVQGGCPHPGAKWVSSPRSRGVGVLTQEQRERVSSLCCRESVLTQEPRGCPHPWTFWVSSPESACRQLTYLVSFAKITAARAEVAVVLHQPLRDPGITFPGRRTSEPCWSVSRRWLPSASQCSSTTGHHRTCWLAP